MSKFVFAEQSLPDLKTMKIYVNLNSKNRHMSILEMEKSLFFKNMI